MTYSLITRCQRTGQFGIGAATALPAVGKLLSYAQAATGAVATQAELNPYLGIDGIRLLAEGCTAQQALERLKQQDAQIERRQLALMDRRGETAHWTGTACEGWAGALAGENFTAQGNRLAGSRVLEAMAAVFRNSAALDLEERLILALEAGEQAGGDKEGICSATIYVVDSEEYPLWDIRVDAHETPVQELRRLHDLFRKELLPQIRAMPKREDNIPHSGAAG